MILNFFKYQGTGNDFVIVDNRENKYTNLSAKQIQHICHRRFGIGADGLMLLANKEGYDFEMIYFNADGNPSSMCGNGGRCLVKFAHHLGIIKNTYHFIATDGEHFAEIDTDKNVRLKMQDVEDVNLHAHYSILNTGSPHYVRFDTEVQKINVAQIGYQIRNSPQFKQKGINVNFVEIINKHSIFVRTYERGVEDETLSCGTGVTAAALMSAYNKKGFNKVEVQTLGGKLSVEFEKTDNEHFKNIWLCGPAEFVFKGIIEV